MKFRFIDANAICDRCGVKTLLSKLRNQPQAGVLTGLKVCRDCYDEDHPQQFVNRETKIEQFAVVDPRPNYPYNQGPVGYNPVPSVTMILSTGKVYAV